MRTQEVMAAVVENSLKNKTQKGNNRNKYHTLNAVMGILQECLCSWVSRVKDTDYQGMELGSIFTQTQPSLQMRPCGELLGGVHKRRYTRSIHVNKSIFWSIETVE